MNTATIKVHSDLKKAQSVAAELGVSLDSIVNSILKQIIKTKKVTFSEADEDPSEYLKAIIKQAEKDYKKGNTSPRFKKAEDFIEFLHKEAA